MAETAARMLDQMTGREVVDYLCAIARDLKSEQKQLREEKSAHPKRRDALTGEEESAWENLLGVLLPTQAPEVLDGASASLGLPGISAAATAAAKEARRGQLVAQVGECEATPEFHQREALKNEVAIRLPGLKEMATPLRGDVLSLEGERFWNELFYDHYGTPEYPRHWYQRIYYRHWREGDRILAVHGQRMRVKDFGALRAKYVSEKQALQSFDAEIAQLAERSQRIETLETKHRVASAGLAKLDDWVLDRARTLVLEHLSALTLQDLMPLLGPDPTLQLAVKRAHGAKAKAAYLDSIQQEWVEKPLEDVNRRLGKVEQGIQKFQRPKHNYGSYPRAEIEAKYGLPSEKWRQRWDRYQTTTQEIIVFNDYGRVDPLTEFLWWDMMVHSHHGGFIPDVCEYHHHHSSHHDTYVASSGNDDFHTRDAS